jgi:anti-anti-sigma regulatory factor
MSNDAMNVTLRKVHDILVVELPVALNAETRPHINEKVEYAMADTPGALILDFARVTAADAEGLQAPPKSTCRWR